MSNPEIILDQTWFELPDNINCDSLSRMSVVIDLNGKIAIVTGAGRGIGRSIAQSLAESGARVILTARTEKELIQVMGEITARGGEALVVRADLGREDEVLRLFEEARNLGRLDILVNNAGLGIFGEVAEFDSRDFDRIMSINLKAVFICCREALRMMLPAKQGYIINISSVVGHKGYPNQGIYTASKHGMMGLTKSLAAELQDSGVRTSVITPGGVDTQMIARARPDLDASILMHPEDIAQTVLFLLSLSDRAAVDEISLRRRNNTPF